MVKSYLRYDGDRSLGVISSRECNVVVDHEGQLLLTGCVESIGVWSLRQGIQVRALKTIKGVERVTRICLKNGTGRQSNVCAAGYTDGSVRLWDYNDGGQLQTFNGHKSAISCLAFDSSGNMLASGAADTDIVLWDVVAESGTARLRGHVDQVTAVLFWEPAGSAGTDRGAEKLISASKDRFIRIWSIEMQLCTQIIAEHKVEVWSLALNTAQDRLVAGGADQYLRLWSLSYGAKGDEEDPCATFTGAVPRASGQGHTLGLEYARPDGVDYEVLLCQSSGKSLELFQCHDTDAVKRRQKRRKKRVSTKKRKKDEGGIGQSLLKDEEKDEASEGEEPAGDVEGLQAEGEQARAADELSPLGLPHKCEAKAVSLTWCAKTNTSILGLNDNSVVALKLAVADDASGGAAALTASPDGGLDIAGHRTAVRALAVAEDDSLLMSASAEAVKIWSSSSTRCIRTMPSGYGLCGFFVSGNEHVVLGTKDGDLELFDLRVGEFRQRLEKAHDGAVYGLAVDPDGGKSFVSCSADKHLKFFNIVEEGTAVSLQADDSPPVELPDEALAVVFSPNGKWIAAALLNHTVQLIFADSRKFYLSLYGHRLPVMSLDMSSDSQVLATGSADKSIKFWSPQFGNCLRSMRAHEESIMQVRFLPGTHYLVSAARDKTVKLWDCDTYELITALQGHSSEIMALALSQDAAFIVTAGADRQIRFWRRTQEQLFLSEERAKELDEQFEKEAERDDIPTAGMAAGGGVSSVRPSRRTIESVRSTERLMEVLDEAKEAKEAGAASRYCPSVRVVQHVNTLNAGNIYEVLLALPFAHSLRMLEFLCEFFEAMSSLPSGGTGSADGQLKLLSAAATLETPCQAALISAYVHHREFSATSTARPLLLRLRTQMRLLLTAERNRIGFAMAGFGHLQRALKRSSAGRLLDALPEPQKKKKKGKA